MSTYVHSMAFAHHRVTAVLVAHDGERWLPRTLAGIQRQHRPVQQLVAVDTGSQDATPELLIEALGASNVLHHERTTSFGAAVSHGLRASLRTSSPITAGGSGRWDDWEASPQDAMADPAIAGDPEQSALEWIWLLHDDGEPAPDALYHLLAAAEADPAAAVIGPKIRGWYNRHELLEVGVSIALTGRRDTGLERGERDQGQRDTLRRVLAVSSAGMLVRRDVWELVAGFDRFICLIRDDVDFGWRVNAAGYSVVVAPAAVVYHAEAVYQGRRPVHATINRPHLVDRASAAYVLLANLPARALPAALPRLVITAVLRAVGFIVAKLPGRAADELLGLLSVLARPDRIVRGRRLRARIRKPGLTYRLLGSLFPSRRSWLRHLGDTVSGLVYHARPEFSSGGRHRAIETGPGATEAEELEAETFAVLRRILRRPGVVLVIALFLLTALATRGLLGSGRLLGGALLPAPDSAAALWRTYLAAWHPVGVGSASPAPPYLAVVAFLGTLLGNNASLAVDVLLLGSVPMAGLTAYAAARRVVSSPLLRIWAAAGYALLPAATGAVASGRLGSAVGIVLLPLLGLGVARMVSTVGRPGTIWTAWATGLTLAGMTAFVPLAWVLALAFTVAGGKVVARRSAWLRVGIVLATPIVVLAPWVLSLVRRPAQLFMQPGALPTDLDETSFRPFAAILFHPGGPGGYPLWITGGVLLAALAAWFRTSRRELVICGWAMAMTGFVGTLVLISLTQAELVSAWPGLTTTLMGAGLLLAALVGAEGVREHIASSSFGWRQLLTVGVAVYAALMPVIAAGIWVTRGPAGPLQRQSGTLLPAYVALQSTSPQRPRTLALSVTPTGAITYAVLRGRDSQLGDAELAPPSQRTDRLTELLAVLASGTPASWSEREVAQLANYAVRYVLLGAPGDPRLARILDSTPGLSRVSASDTAALWQLAPSAARIRVVSPPSSATASQSHREFPVPSEEVGVRAAIPPGPEGRVLALAESANPEWRASLNGTPLSPMVLDGWAQGFQLPSQGGQLVVHYPNTARMIWVAIQVAVVLVVAILALPGIRSRNDQAELQAPELRVVPDRSGGVA